MFQQFANNHYYPLHRNQLLLIILILILTKLNENANNY